MTPLRLIMLGGLLGATLVAFGAEAKHVTDNPQNEFGSKFARAYAAEPTAKPVEPEDGDAGKRTLTKDPVNF